MLTPISHANIGSPTFVSGTRSRSFMMGVVLFLLVVVVYLPAMRCGFIWDDDDYILENKTIQTWPGLTRIWFEPKSTPQYYPLVHSTFWIEYRFWGLNPTGYHIVNILLHAATCVMIWRILLKLEVPGAWLVAAVFGVHPVHVESVAWVTERKNVLSAFCYGMAMFSILPLFGLGTISSSPRFSIKRYFFATVMYVGALLSKSVTCSLPAAILLIVYWKKGRITRRDLSLTIPWFFLGLGAAMQTAWLERTRVGATGPAFSWTWVERCWIAGHALWFYLGKLVWPYPLAFFYPRWSIDVGSAASWILPLAAALLPVVLWLARNRIGRGPLVAILFFDGTLLPALGFVNVYPMRYSFVADHFQYIASLGAIVLIINGLAVYVVHRPGLARWAPCGSVLLLLPLCIMTWRQEAIYRDVESLWTDTLEKNPNSFAAHVHIGKVRLSQGRNEEASSHFHEALRLQTDETETYIILTWLGNSLSKQGKTSEASAAFHEALQRHPKDWNAIHGLATIAARDQRYDEAINLFRRVIALRPKDATVRLNLGNALASVGELEEAIKEYEASLRMSPNSVDARVSLGNALARLGQFPAAEKCYVDALKLKPDHPQANSNLKKVRASMGAAAGQRSR